MPTKHDLEKLCRNNRYQLELPKNIILFSSDIIQKYLFLTVKNIVIKKKKKIWFIKMNWYYWSQIFFLQFDWIKTTIFYRMEAMKSVKTRLCLAHKIYSVTTFRFQPQKSLKQIRTCILNSQNIIIILII